MLYEDTRPTGFPVDDLFRTRWSPRAFSSEDMPENDLLTILEAARFAPSANNNQPWRFVYALRGTPEWEVMISVLKGFNKDWAPNASALVLVYSLSKLTPPGSDEERDIGTHAFDAGAAWMSIALQAKIAGYHAHAMGGVEKQAAAEILDAPEHAHLHVAVAIGKVGDKSTLPEERQKTEYPNARKPLSELAAKGRLIAK